MLADLGLSQNLKDLKDEIRRSSNSDDLRSEFRRFAAGS